MHDMISESLSLFARKEAVDKHGTNDVPPTPPAVKLFRLLNTALDAWVVDAKIVNRTKMKKTFNFI